MRHYHLKLFTSKKKAKLIENNKPIDIFTVCEAYPPINITPYIGPSWNDYVCAEIVQLNKMSEMKEGYTNMRTEEWTVQFLYTLWCLGMITVIRTYAVNASTVNDRSRSISLNSGSFALGIVIGPGRDLIDWVCTAFNVFSFATCFDRLTFFSHSNHLFAYWLSGLQTIWWP